jgi:hypothetical protein
VEGAANGRFNGNLSARSDRTPLAAGPRPTTPRPDARALRRSD